MIKQADRVGQLAPVRGAATRPDGQALSAIGYPSPAPARQPPEHHSWLGAAHTPDRLVFHKRAGAMAFTFGFDADNHAVNTCRK